MILPAPCPFCDVGCGRARSCAVWEDDDLLAFLDRNPIRPGHLQLISKLHYAYFDDLPAYLTSRFFLTGQLLAKRTKPVLGVARVGFVCTGGDVAHAHAHLMPLHAKTDVTSLRYFEEGDIKVAQPAPEGWDALEVQVVEFRKAFRDWPGKCAFPGKFST